MLQVERIVAERTPEQQARLAAEFELLLTAQGLTKSLDLQNKRKFRGNLVAFLNTVRRFLLVK